MFNWLSVKIIVPIVALMVALGASLYFGVLQTVDEFARTNIEKDLENLNHELFNVVDNAFMQVVKSVKANDRVAVRIRQVDCLDILERKTYSQQFKLIVVEKQSGTVRLVSDLPGQVKASEIIQRFQTKKDAFLLQTADGEFYVRQFYFPPWDWSFLVLKNTRTYTELSQKVSRVYLTSTVVLLIATILLVTYLLRSIKAPIGSIISSLAQGKSPDYRGTYEFEYLGQAIGAMRSSLKDSEEALQKANEKLEQRVEERTLELRKTYNQLLHAEKLATSGSIAASLAHEFGNPLYGIKGVLSAIAQQETLPPDNTRMVGMAIDECDRMSHLLQSLQDFNRPTSGEKTLTSLHRVIDDIVIFSRRNLERKAIVIKKEYDPALRPIMVITDQIKQVIINLINNSIYACAKGGEITISTSAQEKNVIIRIRDNGHGVKEDDLSRIFEPFFTTKDVAMGTGLGLSVSYGIIRRHGGTIEVASKVGEGATFTITLPTENQEDI